MQNAEPEFVAALIRATVSGVRYRRYQSGDFHSLYAIEEGCFEPPLRFPLAYMRALVESSRAAVWIAEEIAEENRRMAGFAIVEWTMTSEQSGKAIAYIQTLEVAFDFRRRGIGAGLLNRLESSAQSAGARLIWLHVDAKNAQAIHLYEAHGYKFDSQEENYYGLGRPALIYAKSLAAGAAL